MDKNLINKKVALGISDPWDLGDQLGWKELEATIVNVKSEMNVQVSIAIKLNKSFYYHNIHCEYFIASPRLKNVDFSHLASGKTVFCGLTRVSPMQISSNDPFNLNHWRGGIGLIGEVKLKY